MQTKKQIGKKKKIRPSPWTTQPPIPKDHLCSEQIQLVQKWQFSRGASPAGLFVSVHVFHVTQPKGNKATVANLGETKLDWLHRCRQGAFLTLFQGVSFVWLFINKKLQVLHKAIWGSNPFGQRGTLHDINLPFHYKDMTVTNWQDLGRKKPFFLFPAPVLWCAAKTENSVDTNWFKSKATPQSTQKQRET